MGINEYDLQEKYEVMKLLTHAYETDKTKKILKGIILKLRGNIDEHKLRLMKNKYNLR